MKKNIILTIVSYLIGTTIILTAIIVTTAIAEKVGIVGVLALIVFGLTIAFFAKEEKEEREW